MKILNMGSGYNPIKGAVNLDINPACNPDVVHDLEKPLPFPDNAFDKAVGIEVMEHLKNTHEVMQEIRRVLKPEGMLELAVPYHGLIKNILISILYWGTHYNPTGEHLRFYNEQSFRYIFKRNGFKILMFKRNGNVLASTMTITGKNGKLN